MDRKFSISIIITVGAFVLTVYLFIVALVFQNDLTPIDPISKPLTVDTPAQLQESVHPGAKIFMANCKACHRIHQKLVGPALAGVTERRDSLWIIKMIRNSSQLIASGDPTAVQLFEEFNRTQMTSFTSFTDEELRALLEYLKLESKRTEKPVPATKVEV